MSKTDLILEHVIKIESKMGAVEQHLKTINGSISEHKIKINELTKRQYWAFGVGAGILVIAGFVIKLI